MRFKKSEPNVVEADMTPMIDIVFQLIAFFMIVTNFEQTRADERVVLPADDLARPPVAARDEITVNIGFLRDKQGVKIDETAYVFVPGEDPVPLAGYKPNLESEARVATQYEGKKLEDITIAIRADAQAPGGLVQELIKMSRDVGFSSFSLKATVGEGPQ